MEKELCYGLCVEKKMTRIRNKSRENPNLIDSLVKLCKKSYTVYLITAAEEREGWQVLMSDATSVQDRRKRYVKIMKLQPLTKEK